MLHCTQWQFVVSIFFLFKRSRFDTFVVSIEPVVSLFESRAAPTPVTSGGEEGSPVFAVTDATACVGVLRSGIWLVSWVSALALPTTAPARQLLSEVLAMRPTLELLLPPSSSCMVLNGYSGSLEKQLRHHA